MLEQKLQEAVRAIPAPAGLKANIVAACREALAAPVAEKKATVAPVWRWTAAVACLLLAAGVTWKLLPRDNGGVVPNLSSTTLPTTSSAIPPSSTTATAQPTTQSTTKPTTGTTDWEGQGGGGLETHLYVKNVKLAGIHDYFYEYVLATFGSETFSKVTDEMKVAKTAVPSAYVGDSTHFWVHRLDIPREKFVELNEKTKGSLINYPERLEKETFTNEEIDDIYNLTTEEFNKKYKAPTAVLVGKVIYNFDWLYKNDIDLWQKQNFTVEQLQEAVDNAKKMENFPQGIAEAVEKKLNDYIAAVGEA